MPKKRLFLLLSEGVPDAAEKPLALAGPDPADDLLLVRLREAASRTARLRH